MLPPLRHQPTNHHSQHLHPSLNPLICQPITHSLTKPSSILPASHSSINDWAINYILVHPSVLSSFSQTQTHTPILFHPSIPLVNHSSTHSHTHPSSCLLANHWSTQYIFITLQPDTHSLHSHPSWHPSILSSITQWLMTYAFLHLVNPSRTNH